MQYLGFFHFIGSKSMSTWIERHWDALAQLALTYLRPPHVTLRVQDDGQLVVCAPKHLFEHITVMLPQAVGTVLTNGVVQFTSPDKVVNNACYIDVLEPHAFPHVVMLHGKQRLFETDAEWLKTYTPQLEKCKRISTIFPYTAPVPDVSNVSGDVLRVLLQVWPEIAALPTCVLSQPRPSDDSDVWDTSPYRCWHRFCNFSVNDVKGSVEESVQTAILAAAAETVDELQLLKIEAVLHALGASKTVCSTTWDRAKEATQQACEALPALAAFDTEFSNPQQLSTIAGSHNFFITAKDVENETDATVQAQMCASARFRGGIHTAPPRTSQVVTVNGKLLSTPNIQPFDIISTQPLSVMHVMDKQCNRCTIATRSDFCITDVGYYTINIPETGTTYDLNVAYTTADVQKWVLADADTFDPVSEPFNLLSTSRFCIVPVFPSGHQTMRKMLKQQLQAMRKKVPRADTSTITLNSDASLFIRSVDAYTFTFDFPNWGNDLVTLWTPFLTSTCPVFTLCIETDTYTVHTKVSVEEALNTLPRDFTPTTLHYRLYDRLMENVRPSLLHRAITVLNGTAQPSTCSETPSPVKKLEDEEVCAILTDADWDEYNTCVLKIPGTLEALETNAEILPFGWVSTDPTSLHVWTVRVELPCESVAFIDTMGQPTYINLQGSVVEWPETRKCVVLNCGLSTFRHGPELNVNHQVAKWMPFGPPNDTKIRRVQLENTPISTKGEQVFENTPDDTSITQNGSVHITTTPRALSAWMCSTGSSKKVYIYNNWGEEHTCALHMISGDTAESTFDFHDSGYCALEPSAPYQPAYMPSTDDTSIITKEWGAGLRAVDFLHGRITNSVQMFAARTSASSLFVHPQCNSLFDGHFPLQSSFKPVHDNNSIMEVFGYTDEHTVVWPGNVSDNRFIVVLRSDAYYNFLVEHLCKNAVSTMSSFEDTTWLTIDTSHRMIDAVCGTEELEFTLEIVCCSTQDVYKITHVQIRSDSSVMIRLHGIASTEAFNYIRLHSLPPTHQHMSDVVLALLQCFLGQVPMVVISLPAFITSMICFDGTSLYSINYGTVELPSHLQACCSDHGRVETVEEDTDKLLEVRLDIQQCKSWPAVAGVLQQYSVVVQSDVEGTLVMLEEEGWPCDDLSLMWE